MRTGLRSAALLHVLIGLLTPALTTSFACGWAIRPNTLERPRCAAAVAQAAPKERKQGPNTAGAPPPDDLSDENMLDIVLERKTDEEVNALIWKYIGYRYDDEAGAWDASRVFPKWAAKYPTPPDLLGVTRTYTREIDEPVLRAVQVLQKSVPREHKDNLRAFLKPLGWNGYKMEGLTPNKTRRAQVAQWLYYYREALHGVSIEELRRRRDERAKTEQAGPTGTINQAVI